MAKRRRDEFVVGWPTVDRPVFGREGRGGAAFPVAANRVLRVRRTFPKDDNGEKPEIYRLVPVTVAEVKAQAKREKKVRKGKR